MTTFVQRKDSLMSLWSRRKSPAMIKPVREDGLVRFVESIKTISNVETLPNRQNQSKLRTSLQQRNG